MSISSVYEKYFGLEEHPFSITPDPRFVYLSDKHREALEHLKQGAVGGANGFVLLTGDVGTGKTTLCRTFLEQVPPKTEVALILNPVLTLNEFLQTICEELDLVIEGSRESNKNLIDHLNRFLVQVYALGQKTILIVDEAQNLSHELLEQIRLLTNLETNSDKLLLIFLIGQPELREILDRPDMQQVSQRITSRYHLGPLDKEETRAYIEKRLEVAGGNDIEFTAAAVRRIYAFSGGVPRLINVLCDKALLCAYENATQKITAAIAKEAEERVRGNLTRAGAKWGTKVAGIAAAGVALAAIGGVGYWIHLTGWPPGFGSTSEPVAIQDNRAAKAPLIASTAVPPDRTPTEAAAPSSIGNPAGSEPMTTTDTSRSPTVVNSRISSDHAQSSTEDVTTGMSQNQRAVMAPASQTSPSSTSQLPMPPGEAPAESQAKVATTPVGSPGATLSTSGAQPFASSQPGSSGSDASFASVPVPENSTNPATSRAGSVASATTDEPAALSSSSIAATQPSSMPDQSRTPIAPAPAPRRAPGGDTSPKGPPSPTATVTALDNTHVAAPRTDSQPSDMLTEHVEGITATPAPDTSSAKGQGDVPATPRKPSSRATQSARTEIAMAKQPSRRAQTLTSYTKKVAERKLLNLWGIPGEPPNSVSLCQFARQNGLNCLRDNRGLRFLYIYNRPALVSIRVDNLNSYAVVTKATPEKVVLDVLDRTHEIPANLFPNIWDGSFLVLYRVPKDFRGSLTPGHGGENVVKLRQIMDQLDGEQTRGDTYDAELVSRVKKFQRSVGLKPDGIVGPRTLMVMRNKLAELKQ